LRIAFQPCWSGSAESALHRSRAVSRVRQPIESLFNWIEEKAGIEMASKVRSSQGLLVHVFGRLAAAMFVRNVLPQSA